MARKICEIAAEIKKEFPNVAKHYASKPYLDALLCLESPADKYIEDSGLMVASYFLSNASRLLKGEKGKALKAELKAAYGLK